MGRGEGAPAGPAVNRVALTSVAEGRHCRGVGVVCEGVAGAGAGFSALRGGGAGGNWALAGSVSEPARRLAEGAVAAISVCGIFSLVGPERAARGDPGIAHAPGCAAVVAWVRGCGIRPAHR